MQIVDTICFTPSQPRKRIGAQNHLSSPGKVPAVCGAKYLNSDWCNPVPYIQHNSSTVVQLRLLKHQFYLDDLRLGGRKCILPASQGQRSGSGEKERHQGWRVLEGTQDPETIIFHTPGGGCLWTDRQELFSQSWVSVSGPWGPSEP